MIDKSWMLNPQAIRYAKHCIQLIKDELGIKLKLSHPEFLKMIHEYADMTDSDELAHTFDKLIKMAGPGFVYDDSQNSNVHSLPARSVVANTALAFQENTDNSVEVHGKSYTKWRGGKQFKGVYRGQPSYG